MGLVINAALALSLLIKGVNRLQVLFIDLDGLKAAVLLVPLLNESGMGDRDMTRVLRGPGVNGAGPLVGQENEGRSASNQESKDL